MWLVLRVHADGDGYVPKACEQMNCNTRLEYFCTDRQESWCKWRRSSHTAWLPKRFRIRRWWCTTACNTTTSSRTWLLTAEVRQWCRRRPCDDVWVLTAGMLLGGLGSHVTTKYRRPECTASRTALRQLARGWTATSLYDRHDDFMRDLTRLVTRRLWL